MSVNNTVNVKNETAKTAATTTEMAAPGIEGESAN
jgi:hypothetical protein